MLKKEMYMLAVYKLIETHYEESEENFTLSTKEIIYKLNLSYASVSTALNNLEELGYITKTSEWNSKLRRKFRVIKLTEKKLDLGE